MKEEVVEEAQPEEVPVIEEPVVEEEQPQNNEDVVEETPALEEENTPQEEPSHEDKPKEMESPKPDKPNKKKNKLVLIIILVVAAIVLCSGSVAAAVIIANKKAHSSTTSKPHSTQSPSMPSSTSSSSSSSSSISSTNSAQPAYRIPDIAVSSVNVVKKEEKAYLQIVGTTDSETDLKVAFALYHCDTEEYIVGSATFSDGDYNLDIPVANESFTFEYNLSDISGIEPGTFTIVVAVKGLTFNLGTTNSGLSVKDDNYRYYMRTDEQVGSTNALAIDELPPFEMSEATIVTIGTKPFAKIGGLRKAGVTQALLDSYDSFVQFQFVGTGWAITKRYKDLGQFYYEVSDDKAYIYIDIGFFVAGSKYNTHLNVTKNEQADCKMETAINNHYIVQNDNGVEIDVQVYANPSAASNDPNEFWGNLGFIVSAVS